MTRARPPRLQRLFGMEISALSLEGVVAAVDDLLARRQRGYVVTPNADHVVRYHRDPMFRAAYEAAALRAPDGMVVVWAARMLGRPVAGRAAGADLLPGLCRLAASRGHTVFLLGGREGVAARAAARLVASLPVLKVSGIFSPPDEFGEDAAATEVALQAVRQATPDLLFIGLGSPKQELWAHRHWDRLACTVAICCGAAIDYAAGVKPRAPAWMQRAGLEWLWRLAHEPRRLWRRYLVDDVAFLGIFLKEWWRLRVRKQAP